MSEVKNQKGGIKVDTQHIFPIIKKWLYSEKDIFLREIVSNASDAITKLERLVSLGEVKGIDDKARIDVILDRDEKTLTVMDNGIGMTEEEVEKYICQIALSGALDFIEKYEGKSENAGSGIIGHFGLGFYSAFMVSDTVEVYTKSYTGGKAVKWTCDASGEYEMEYTDKETRGTSVVMHVIDEESEYFSEYKVREILNKYCSFMPFEIYYTVIDSEKEKDKEKDKDGSKEKEEETPVNNTHPLWLKQASECSEDEYKEFYRKLFNDYREPLFHIHINADYPLNFKGILFFPRINREYESLEGQVKLYYNQVFVSDNIKELIPEYMLMLKGVLDCPELPLNVSRSYLQDNVYVAKMSAHIVKKIADKINSMFANDRGNYEKIWTDIKVFLEFGCLKDNKFYERVKNSMLLALTDGRYTTVDDYIEKAKEKHEKKIYYTTDKTIQSQYISLYTSQNIEVVCLDTLIDTQFINIVEQDKGLKFIRVDADIDSSIKGDGETTENKALTKLFIKVSGNEKLNVKYDVLKDENIAAIVNISEESRRLEDMMKMYSMTGAGMGDNKIPIDETLVLNTSNSVIKLLMDNAEGGNAEKAARQVYSLALLGQRQLTPAEMRAFVSDTLDTIVKGLEIK